MVKHTNFYETLQEARMRLRHTIVMYAGEPYWVHDVTDHEDGRFRVYMDEVGHYYVGGDRHSGFPYVNEYPPSEHARLYDKYIDDNPDSGFIRKLASSKHFNKFRPFPLGNVNYEGSVVYCERSPTRNMHQGMLNDAVLATTVTSAPSRTKKRGLLRKSEMEIGNFNINTLSPEFADMLRGNYPSFQEVIDNLRNPKIANSGCAFNRDWSILRGPIDTLCLCYKHEGVGIIDDDNSLVLGSNFNYLYESVTEMNIFSSIKFKNVRTVTDEHS